MKQLIIPVLLLLILLGTKSKADEFETIVRLSYYSKPVSTLEWSITIFRSGHTAYVQIENFRSNTRKRSIYPERYKKFITIMDREHLLNIDSDDRISDESCYYKLYYKYRGVSKAVVIDPLKPHIGKKKGIPVIIRTIINYGILIMPE
ncbi:MAG: hypothetical protein JXK07_02480 [Spirochaetes bacterium]|nr:hypothetical protein [Spirochaetota bacterium]MBN2771919.1 hypothetical protein [Spirochaetota bacterium]